MRKTLPLPSIRGRREGIAGRRRPRVSILPGPLLPKWGYKSIVVEDGDPGSTGSCRWRAVLRCAAGRSQNTSRLRTPGECAQKITFAAPGGVITSSLAATIHIDTVIMNGVRSMWQPGGANQFVSVRCCCCVDPITAPGQLWIQEDDLCWLLSQKTNVIIYAPVNQ
jgi:hypothetical protein